MADSTRDIELRLRARDLTNAGFDSVKNSVNGLTGAIDKQIDAATNLTIKEKELRETLKQLEDAARNVAGLDATIKQYKTLSQQIDQQKATLDAAKAALQNHAAAMEAGTAKGKQAETAQNNFEKAISRAEARLISLNSNLQKYEASLATAGVAVEQLNTTEQENLALATQIGEARTKLGVVVNNYARIQREAQEANAAAAKAARDEIAALKAQTDARRQANEALRTELSGSLTAFNTRAEQNALEIDAQRKAHAVWLQDLKMFNDKNLRDTISADLIAFNEKVEARNRQKATQAQVLSDQAKFNAETKRLSKERVDAENRAARDTADQVRRDIKARQDATIDAIGKAEAAQQKRQGGGGTNNRGNNQTQGFLGLRPYEITNLGYQINDVFTGLASGQQATQILAQQGGQFFQIFGLAALKWLPLVAVALGAVSVAVGSVTANLRTLSSNREFTALLETNKYAADQSAVALTNLRKTLRDLGVSWDDAGKTIKTALDANIRPEKMDEVAVTARNMARVMGKDVPTAMKDFTDGISGGIDAFDRLIEQYPAIGAENAKYLRGLIASGDQQKFQTETLRILNAEYSKAAKDRVTPLQDAIEKLTGSWNRFNDTVGGSKVFTGLVDGLTKTVEGLTKTVQWLDTLAAKLDDPKVQAAFKVIGFLVNPAKGVADILGNAAGQTLGPTAAALLGPFAGASSVPTGTRAENANTIKQTLSSRGYTGDSVNSILGNLQIESGFDPTATGPLGHRGIGQWDESRRAPLGGVFTDLMAQINLLDSELSKLDPTFKNFTGSVAEGTKRFRDVFERPIGQKDFGTQKDINDLRPRVAAAQRFAGGDGSAPGTPAAASGGGVTSGPNAAQNNAGERENRQLKAQLDLLTAQSEERQKQLIIDQARIRLTNEGIHGDQQNQAIEKEVAVFQYERNKINLQHRQEEAKQTVEDGRNRLAIVQAGLKAEEEARKAGISNYNDIYEARKRGEAEARADIQKRKQETDALDAATKRVDELQRGLLDQHKAALDKLNEATNLRYDNETKALEKLNERQSTTDKAVIDAQKTRLEGLRQIELAQNARKAAEEQASQALSTRSELVNSYTKLEAAGEITITEKEAKIKEAYDLTRGSISAAADALEQFIATNKDLSDTEVAKLTARVKELRAETKYVDPFWKGLRDTFTNSFTSNVDSAFNTITQSIGNAITKTGQWKDVWKSVGTASANFVAGLLKDLATYILKIQAAKLASELLGGTSFGNFLGIAGPAASAASSATSDIPASVAATGGLWHSGGVVGKTAVTATRIAPASFWASAPRYHSGTIVGLAPDEQRAILQRDEEVLSKDDPRNILNGGGGQMGDINIRSVLVDNPNRVPEAMTGAHGERVVLQHLIRNAATVRQIVRG